MLSIARLIIGIVLRRVIISYLFLYSHILSGVYRFAYPNLSIGGGVRFFPGARVMITDGGRMHIGSGTLLHRRCTLQAFGGKITIGDNSFIGEATIIVSALRISIGSDALIAENVSIRDQNHPLTSDNIPRRAKPTEAKEISIGRDVWISAGVIVTSGVTIGNGSVVGGGAVVTRDIPECSIATGVPARVRKNLG